MAAHSPKAALPLLASLARKRTSAVPEPAKENEGGDDRGAETGSTEKREKKNKKKKAVKARKGAPQEVSSRRATAPPRATHEIRHVAKARDPRFDDLSGKLDVDLFQKSYAFLQDWRDEELEAMKKEAGSLRKKNSGKKRRAADVAREADISAEIRQRTQQDKQRRRIGELQDATRALKKQEHAKVRETGKKPYYHGANAVREMVNAERKKGNGKGGRDKQLERREKKTIGREKKRLPTRRMADGE